MSHCCVLSNHLLNQSTKFYSALPLKGICLFEDSPHLWPSQGPVSVMDQVRITSFTVAPLLSVPWCIVWRCPFSIIPVMAPLLVFPGPQILWSIQYVSQQLCGQNTPFFLSLWPPGLQFCLGHKVPTQRY